MEQTDGTCAFCRKPIDVGEAWMRSDQEGAEAVAHSGCLYAEEMEPDQRAWWVPAEYGPNE